MSVSHQEERPFNPPSVNAETRTFWDAAKEGKLLFKVCSDCSKPHWYPRAHCPFCLSSSARWEISAGTGSIYSFSITRKPDPVPYVIAYVTLDSGITMMTRIVDCNVDEVFVDQRVQVVFRSTEGGPPVPAFTPV